MKRTEHRQECLCHETQDAGLPFDAQANKPWRYRDGGKFGRLAA
jgi:hypothetical protein